MINLDAHNIRVVCSITFVESVKTFAKLTNQWSTFSHPVHDKIGSIWKSERRSPWENKFSGGVFLQNSPFVQFLCILERTFGAIFDHCCPLVIVRATLPYFFARRQAPKCPVPLRKIWHCAPLQITQVHSVTKVNNIVFFTRVHRLVRDASKGCFGRGVPRYADWYVTPPRGVLTGVYQGSSNSDQSNLRHSHLSTLRRCPNNFTPFCGMVRFAVLQQQQYF